VERVDEALSVVEAFNQRFNAHDVEGALAMMTDDAVFESTSPAPDGLRYVGQAQIRAVWTGLFTDASAARFDVEESFTVDDRVVVRWRYDWGDGHVRGVDLFTVRDGKVAAKLSYVKG
jgi:ketosteroid isomerase-like protein